MKTVNITLIQQKRRLVLKILGAIGKDAKDNFTTANFTNPTCKSAYQ